MILVLWESTRAGKVRTHVYSILNKKSKTHDKIIDVYSTSLSYDTFT